jgi:hypothetical protein
VITCITLMGAIQTIILQTGAPNDQLRMRGSTLARCIRKLSQINRETAQNAA